MTLLDPLSAILTGAIAGPILVALYFLKLRRRRVRVASTLLWQRAVQDLQVNEPFRWLRPSLLLFLQLLALALLAIAIGRPAIPGGLSASGRVILLIDRSASMNALDGEGGTTRFDDAIRAASETIEELPRGTSITIVAYAGAPTVLLSATTDRSAAKRALERITPSDQPDNLASAFELLGALTAGQADETESPEEASVILFSDGGYEETGFALTGAELVFRRMGPSESAIHDNLGITAISIAGDFNDPSLTRLFLRLENALDREVGATVIMTGPSGEIGRRGVRVPPNQNGTPGSQSLTFELDRGLIGLVTAWIDRADRLETDNTAHAIIEPARRPRVLLVSPEGENDPSGWVLGDILREMDLEILTRVSADGLPAMLSGGELSAFDLIVFDRVDVPAGVPAPTISFGAALPGWSLETESEDPDRLTSWNRTHPILRGLVLDAVRLTRTVRFVPTETAPPTDELAAGRLGPLMLLLTEGRWNRLGVAFEPTSSNWPLLDISYPLFLVQSVEFLTFDASADGNTPATTDRPATIEAAPGEGELVLQGPITISARLPGGTQPGQSVRLSLGVPERAGVYTDAQERPVLAVNLASSRESGLATRDTLQVAGKPVVAGSLAEGLTEIWHWFVLLATAALTAEWLIFARKMRA